MVFDVQAVLLDGEERVDVNVSRANRRWAFPTDDWERCRIVGTVELPSSVVDAVYPESERDSPPGSLYVTIRCRETIYRDRWMVQSETVEPKTYEVELELQRDGFRGEVELKPYLTRGAADQSTDDGSYASSTHARLASARPWTMLVDGEADADGETGLDVRVESFSTSPRLPKDGLYYLDMGDPSDPLIVVNGEHNRVVGVLQSEGSVGAEARMRDVVFDQIQYGVWSQLILHAGVAVDSTGRPQYDWQSTVLRIFARDLYGIDDIHAASRRLKRDLKDPTTVPEVMQRIDRVLQRYLRQREQLINLMEEGLRI
ncbi:hypothetical protein [Halomarina rubra]|uniref:Uncharacterized protein n=1 Tax=Halomarina rubra TaxID=2071873 RepID=A0ABD6AV66_9EURY|nr:hypothetical protein [Halomarina rubra]